MLGKEGSIKNRLFFIVNGLVYATQKELDGKDVRIDLFSNNSLSIFLSNTVSAILCLSR